jgi:hypothetical protein
VQSAHLEQLEVSGQPGQLALLEHLARW